MNSVRQKATAIMCVLVVGIATWIVLSSSGNDADSASQPSVPQSKGPTPPALRGNAPEEVRDLEPAPPLIAEGTSWTGTVRDGRTSEPIEGARVAFGARAQGFADGRRGARTDRDGRFSLPVDKSATADALWVTADGYLPSSADPPPQGKEADVRLDRGQPIGGVVLDLFGNPIPGARVTATHVTNRASYPVAYARNVLAAGVQGSGGTAQANDQGRFLIVGAVPNEQYELRAAREGFWTYSPTRALAGETDATVRVQARTRIGVRFLHEGTGDPVRHSRTVVEVPGQAWFTPQPLAGLLAAQAGVPSEGQDGSAEYRWFDFTDNIFATGELPPDGPEEMSFTLRAYSLGYEPQVRVIQARRGATTLLDVQLRPLEATAWRVLRPRAQFADGRPYSGPLKVTIASLRSSGPYSECECQFENGEARSTFKLPVGSYRVSGAGSDTTFTHTWWKSAAESVVLTVTDAPTEQSFTLALTGGPVALHVVDGSGRAVFGYDLAVLRDGSGSSVEAWATHALLEAGQLTVDQLHDPVLWLGRGEFELTASLQGVGTGSATVQGPVGGDPRSVQIILSGVLR